MFHRRFTVGDYREWAAILQPKKQTTQSVRTYLGLGAAVAGALHMTPGAVGELDAMRWLVRKNRPLQVQRMGVC